jgi:excisionase family DNA binding protein
MGIRSKRPPKVLLALTVTTLCNALDYVRPEIIRKAIADGELPAHVVGTKTLILTSDAEEWIRSHPRPRTRRKGSEVPSE